MKSSPTGRRSGPSSAVPTCKSSNGSAPQRHVPRPIASSSPSTAPVEACPPPHPETPEAVPRLLERLAHLATAERDLAGSPPLRTYVERSDGALPYVVATNEYRQWFCRTYGVARDEVEKPVPRTGEPDSGDRKPANGQPLAQFKRSVAVQHQIAA